MTHRLDEILAKSKAITYPLPTIGNIEGTILEAHRVGRINLAYRAAQDLENMEYEIRTLKELLYEAQHINMLSDGEGGGAWSVNGDLEERIDKALEGFEIEN